jgi:hypothetical protein
MAVVKTKRKTPEKQMLARMQKQGNFDRWM